MSEQIDGLYARVKRWVGTCASNTETQNIKDALEKGIQATRVAWIMTSDPTATKYLGQALEGMEKISETIETVQNICLDLKAVMCIHAAIKILDDDQVIRRDPDKAAKAFGALFAGFGRLCRHLPSPAKEYGQFLEGAGDFFYNMRRGINADKMFQDRWKRLTGLPDMP
jgi:hypothetical protein